MLRLFKPKSIEEQATLIEFEPGSEVDTIHLSLMVWHEDDTTKFIYSPGGNAKFLTENVEQKLTVTLKSQIYISPEGKKKPRFDIFGFTTQKKALVVKSEYKTRTSISYAPTNKPHDLPNLEDIHSATFTLKLKKNQDSTYLNILIKDLMDGSITDCDPQAENGTKTGP
jgi:hypothetical protein